MAFLENRKGSFRVRFRFDGREEKYTLGDVTEQEARLAQSKVEMVLLRLKQGLLELPEGMGIAEFIQFDGKPPQKLPSHTLGDICQKYTETHEMAHESTTAYTMGIHFRHLKRIIGEGFSLKRLDLEKLQDYVNKRSQAAGRRKQPLSSSTIKKELESFRTLWIWAERMKFVTGSFPNQGLTFPKEKEKPPFMTRAEIGRKLAGLTDDEKAELYEALYLTIEEIPEFLLFLQKYGSQPFLYPMAMTAAHTGARRSELCRILLSDVDFPEGIITIREKKRVKGKLTTRRVPMSQSLYAVLKEWISNHPGGKYLFSQKDVARSRTKSPTTGHQGKGRATTTYGRLANVTSRAGESLPVTVDEAHDHLTRSVANSNWKHAGRWHVLRHSFISACASAAIDQRFIDEWVGHQTEEQRRRYRHLTPASQKQAIRRLFD